MQQNECTRNCWIAAGVIGLLVWIFASFIGQTSVIGGLFLGLIATVLMGLLLVWALCNGSGSAADDRHDGIARSRTASTPMVTPAPMPLQSAAPAAAPTPSAPPAPVPAAAAAAPAPAAVTEAKRPVEAKPESKAEPKAAAAAPAAAKESKPAAKPAEDKKAEPKAAKKPEPKAETKTAAAKPAKAAAKTKPDDLKQIKGVGPKLEQLLHENGITQFAQIAAWTEAQIDEFAEKIGSMGGRIRSDDWLAQAKTLAEGGSTEFAQRVKKGDVY